MPVRPPSLLWMLTLKEVLGRIPPFLINSSPFNPFHTAFGGTIVRDSEPNRNNTTKKPLKKPPPSTSPSLIMVII